jgi:hypothetical protein
VGGVVEGILNIEGVEGEIVVCWILGAGCRLEFFERDITSLTRTDVEVKPIPFSFWFVEDEFEVGDALDSVDVQFDV